MYGSFRLDSAGYVGSKGAREVGWDRIIRFLLTVIESCNVLKFSSVLDCQGFDIWDRIIRFLLEVIESSNLNLLKVS